MPQSAVSLPKPDLHHSARATRRRARGTPSSNAWGRAPLYVLVATAILLGGACDETANEETELFQAAEQHYSHGDYDGARQLYEEFLRQHPLSPFAPIAQQRMRIADRELDSVMGRRGAPAPVRVNPYAATPVPEPTEAPLDVRAPAIPSLGR